VQNSEGFSVNVWSPVLAVSFAVDRQTMNGTASDVLQQDVGNRIC
jgi:hypothetical protein